MLNQLKTVTDCLPMTTNHRLMPLEIDLSDTETTKHITEKPEMRSQQDDDQILDEALNELAN